MRKSQQRSVREREREREAGEALSLFVAHAVSRYRSPSSPSLFFFSSPCFLPHANIVLIVKRKVVIGHTLVFTTTKNGGGKTLSILFRHKKKKKKRQHPSPLNTPPRPPRPSRSASRRGAREGTRRRPPFSWKTRASPSCWWLRPHLLPSLSSSSSPPPLRLPSSS